LAISSNESGAHDFSGKGRFIVPHGAGFQMKPWKKIAVATFIAALAAVGVWIGFRRVDHYLSETPVNSGIVGSVTHDITPNSAAAAPAASSQRLVELEDVETGAGAITLTG
jgi:hypothetical protein